MMMEDNRPTGTKDSLTERNLTPEWEIKQVEGDTVKLPQPHQHELSIKNINPFCKAMEIRDHEGKVLYTLRPGEEVIAKTKWVIDFPPVKAKT